MPRLPISGADDNVWGDILNAYLRVAHNPDGTLGDGTVDGSQLQTGAVTTSALANGAVTAAKLASDVPASGEVLSYDGSGLEWTAPAAGSTDPAMGGDLSGTASNAQIMAGAVGTAELAAGAVTDANLSVGANIAQSKIANLTPDLAAKEATANKGAANGYAPLDGSSTVPVANLPIPALTRTYPFFTTGTLQVAVGTHQLYNDSGVTWTITSVRASVGSSSSGASVTVDINKNGTTIFTTQANRPAIAAGSNTSGRITNMDITAVASGDYLTVDVDQIGSTTAGTDLTVQVEVR